MIGPEPPRVGQWPGGLAATAIEDPLIRPSARRILVVGDAFLDRDHVGRVERVCTDDPALVVSGGRVLSRPGGAGLAAVLAADAGHATTLVTAIGADPAGAELRALLGAAGVELIDFGLDGPTAVKTRIRSADRTLMMLDEHDQFVDADCCAPGSAQRSAELALAAADGIVVSDYGRGLTRDPALRATLAAVARRRPVVWDPHTRGAPPVPGCRFVTPNRREAGVRLDDGGRSTIAEEIRAGREIVRAWGPISVALTRGSQGALFLADETTPASLITARAVTGEGTDACGAGDRLAIELAVALADGRLPDAAVAAAVAAASRYVADGGPDSLRHSGLQRARAAAGGDPRRAAVELARAIRAGGGSVVATGGCFDLLHAGHVQILAQARELGDCLIVCLNSDDSVTRLKGPSRPIVRCEQRSTVLEGLASVDAVLVFDEDTPEEAIRAIRPDIWVKGGDYTLKDLPEQELIAALGGVTVLLPYLSGCSTTALVDEAARTRL
jgi:D-beta-D-heptose 7-phosphate kinase/D-beta-D-heptose 1-phosphate adenosyltransferase